jgi:hypothetical protein
MSFSPEEKKLQIRIAGLERELKDRNDFIKDLSRTLVMWYTFFFGFIFAAVAWSITRCYDATGRATTFRPLYVVGAFCLVQTALALDVSRRCYRDLVSAKQRCAKLVSLLDNPDPNEPPQLAVPAAYHQGIAIMVVAHTSIIVTIICLFVMAKFGLF